MMTLIKSLIQRMKQKATTYYVTVVSPTNASFSTIMNGGADLSPGQLVANFETIPDLFLITDYIATTVANIPVKVVKPSGRDAKNSELDRLIEKPNQYQNWRTLIKLFFSYYEPLGNGYLYGIKPDGMDQVTSLYCLPADKVQIALRYDKMLPNWMNEVSAYVVKIGGKDYTLDASMVFHEKYVTLRYDDGSWIYGMSKYIPGDKISRELKAIHDAKTSIIEQRGALGFITNESENPDPEQSKQVKTALQNSYGLLGDQDKFIVTTEKLKWQQMALGVQELQLIENAKYSFAKMCQINGFDPVIFSTEGSTYANKQQAVKEMMRKVIKTKVDSFYQSLNAFLSPGYNGDEIQADWSKVEELQEDRKEMTDLLTRQIASMIITPKEAREILYGEKEGEEEPPDTFFRTSSLVPAEQPEPDPMPEQVIDPEMVAALDNQQGDAEDNGEERSQQDARY